MEIQIGVTKTSSYTAQSSRETFELMERPNGGHSIVFCNAQKDGERSKAVSSLIVNKVLGLITDGIRDGAAIRAIADLIYQTYDGAASARLSVISYDLESGTLVISRNTTTPVYYAQRGKIFVWKGDSYPIGGSKHIQPTITEIPIEAGTMVCALSEGVVNAGKAYGKEMDIPMLLQSMTDDYDEVTAQDVSNLVLEQAIEMDQKQPHDDMCVIVLRVMSNIAGKIRRSSWTCPIPNFYY